MSDMGQLARRAVACKHWRWMPGMLCIWPNGNEYRVGQVSEIDGINDLPNYPSNGWGDDYPDRTTGTPGLHDAATLGGLLALVREACEPNRAPGDWPMVCTYQSQAKKWGVGAWLNESGKATFAAVVLPTYDTEAAALVAALEAVRAN